MGKAGSKQLSKDELSKLQRSTHFEISEIQRWRRDFLKDCPSGHLKKQDFQNVYQKFFPAGDPKKFATFVFNVFDSDRDGYITFKEFLIALSITSRGNLDEKLDWAFTLYDLDHDGEITKKEMLNIVKAIYDMVGSNTNLLDDENTPEKRVEKIFNQMDRNHDGKLSKQEFQEGAKSDPYIVKALSFSFGGGKKN